MIPPWYKLQPYIEAKIAKKEKQGFFEYTFQGNIDEELLLDFKAKGYNIVVISFCRIDRDRDGTTHEIKVHEMTNFSWGGNGGSLDTYTYTCPGNGNNPRDDMY